MENEFLSEDLQNIDLTPASWKDRDTIIAALKDQSPNETGCFAQNP